MTPNQRLRLATLLLLTGFAALPARAQNAPDSTAGGDSAATGQAGKKKGGLIGKVKHVAESRVVQTVAKTAACTVVPGGQVIAGAIDVANSKNASGAAAGAAQTATGTGCANTMGNLTTAGQQVADQAVQPSAPAGPPPMDPRIQSQLSTLNAMGLATDEVSQAKCLGVSVEEYRLIVTPPAMNTRRPTNAEMKARAAAMKKLDPRKQQACGMQAGSQMMAQVAQMAAGVQQRMAEANAVTMTEAPGRAVQLPAALEQRLQSGKAALTDIDWVAGSAAVSPEGSASFQDALTRLGAALGQVSGRFRLDLYMDSRYDESALGLYGPSRIAMIQNALQAAGVDPARLEAGAVKRDSRPRLELVRIN
jgi:hypothetical protein